MKAWLTVVFLYLISFLRTLGQNLSPVPVTGFNEDIVAEAGNSSLATTTREMDAQSISNYVLCTRSFAEENQFTPANIYGLPDDGELSAASRTYQMSSYTEGNSLYLFPSDTGSLDLVVPSRFTDLSLLALATEGNAQIRVTFHFSDGTRQSESRNVLDWFGPVTNPLFFGYGRVKRKDGPFSAGFDYEAAPGGNPKFSTFDFRLPCTKTLVSIGFRNTSLSGSTSSRAFILAVSGLEIKVTPKIRITASDTSVCEGKSISFTAIPDSQGTNPVYIWKLNGNPVGTNQPTFSSSTLNDEDVITCTLQSTAACAFPASVESSPLKVNILPLLTPKVTVTVDDSSVCAGTPVVFRADVSDAGNPPIIKWRLNGQAAGADSVAFPLPDPENGDEVTCLVFSTAACRTLNFVASNSQTMEVTPVYNLSIQARDTFLLEDPSQAITINPPGGQLSGPGIQGVLFNPTLAGKGDHLVTYSFPENACTDPISKTIHVKEEIFPCLLVPTNLVTRNGDGLNDTWEIGSFNKKCILSASVEIFNRWGVSVYKSDNYKNDWEGKKDNEDLADGCYFYALSYRLAGVEQPKKLSGILSLVR